MMLNPCGRFQMDIFDVVDVVEVSTRASDVELGAADKLEFDALTRPVTSMLLSLWLS